MLRATWGLGLERTLASDLLTSQNVKTSAHSGHWYHLANQLPACWRQSWGPYLSSDKSIQTHGSFEPGELQASVQEDTHYHSVSMQKERQWAHPGPPHLPGMTVKVPDPPLSPHGSASSKDFEFVKEITALVT